MELDRTAHRACDKATVRLLPWLLLMYVMAYLDRANLGFAKDAFQASTGISEAAYALGVGLFFIAYSSVEIPSNILLHRLGPRFWLSRIMITWGVVSAGMATVSTPAEFYAMRFLLGVAEAGFFPGVVYYLSRWFPDARRARVLGIFYFGAPLSFVFGGPLSGLLLEADGMAGWYGWQWMFLVEGLLASVIGVFVYFRLVDKPTNAPWLKPDERAALTAAIAAEDHQKRRTHGASSLLQGLLNWRVVYLGLIYFLIQVCVTGVVYYMPSQIGVLLDRRVGIVVGAVTAIPWAFAILASYLVPRLAERIERRQLVATLTMVCCAIGVSLSSFFSHVPLAALIALCVTVACFISVQPLFWTLPAAYLDGKAAASGLALVNSLGALAGMASPAYRLWAENTFGRGAGPYALGVTTLLGAVMLALAARVLRRRRVAEPGVAVGE